MVGTKKELIHNKKEKKGKKKKKEYDIIVRISQVPRLESRHRIINYKMSSPYIH